MNKVAYGFGCLVALAVDLLIMVALQAALPWVFGIAATLLFVLYRNAERMLLWKRPSGPAAFDPLAIPQGRMVVKVDSTTAFDVNEREFMLNAGEGCEFSIGNANAVFIRTSQKPAPDDDDKFFDGPVTLEG